MKQIQLFACGLNAHRQVDEQDQEDIYEFRLCLQANAISVLFAGWSETTLLVNSSELRRLNSSASLPTSLCESSAPYKKGWGDHNGILGVLNSHDHVQFLNEKNQGLSRIGANASPQIEHIAVASNGHVAVATSSNASHSVLHFRSHDAFLDWYRHPSDLDNKEFQKFDLPAKPSQLVANSVGFTLLTQDGLVWTWGDARYPGCLGREASSRLPCTEPGLVEPLGGLKVQQIASGGWSSMALTEAGDAYVWGIAEPGSGKKDAFAASSGEVSNIRDITTGLAEHDIADIAVGNGHALILLDDGTVWSIGKNSHGQLGQGVSSGKWSKQWKQVQGLSHATARGTTVTGVVCGPCTSLVLVSLDSA